MNQRIAISIGVFVVGFGLGYALTHMLVGGKDEGPGDAEPATASAERHNEAADAVEKMKPTGAAEAKNDEKNLKAEGPNEGEQGKLEKAPKKGGKPGVKTLKTAPANASWWELCLGKKCKLDFGGVKRGLSVRRGTIEHGKRVDWDLRFKRAPRIEILPTDRDIKVLLEGVGFDGKGRPVVAQVRWSDKGRIISGVISLHPGDKTVSMVPDADQ